MDHFHNLLRRSIHIIFYRPTDLNFKGGPTWFLISQELICFCWGVPILGWWSCWIKLGEYFTHACVRTSGDNKRLQQLPSASPGGLVQLYCLRKAHSILWDFISPRSLTPQTAALWLTFLHNKREDEPIKKKHTKSHKCADKQEACRHKMLWPCLACVDCVYCCCRLKLLYFTFDRHH